MPSNKLTVGKPNSDCYRVLLVTNTARLEQLRNEIGGLVTGHPKNLMELNQLAFGLLEMGVVDFFLFNHLTPQQQYFNHNRVRRVLLPDDIRECCVDTVNSISNQLSPHLRYTDFNHPFGAKVLPNLSLLLQVHAEDLAINSIPEEEDE